MCALKKNIPVSESDVAIVGMAAHLPGAPSIGAFWENLRNGVESIRKLTEQELLENGEAAHLLNRPDYVPHAAMLDGFQNFDAEFFGFSPKEAAIMDPQHRQFLETAWEALENAGHPPEKFPGSVGVYAGCGMGSYFYFNICSNPDLVDDVGMFLLRHTGNDKDFMSTRLSHIFDLKGPSINVQTACSTSLVATHYACQGLITGECDMALAGGVTIELPHGRGYIFREGEVLSPDGHCHAFDHRAEGTVFGSGAGVVVLRRLADAIEDGDHIWAVIKGTAINNDGSDKAGYLAPSVDGQAAAIAEAQAMAEVQANTVDYVECHGTGTYLGDPIEVAALTQAFSETTEETGFCRIGSVKTNIGHLDTAAGAASLIKTSLALHHKQLPPSLGYEKPNPAIEFEDSPFMVNDRLTGWESHRGPRRAGVNSLGVGGTNAHAVLEEAPEREASDPADWPFQLLTVSGRGKGALDGNAAALADHLRSHQDQPLADIAWTLKEGRREFEKRRVVVAETHEEAAQLLEENDPRRAFSHSVVAENPEIVFMFPGGGAQYAGMARDLYETEPVFQDWMDRGLDILQPQLDYDIRALWLPEPGEEEAADARLKTPSVQLPLIMIVEYALAQLWMSWGVTPAALVGHSMGENTAACIAGVMSFEDCIGLVYLRGRLFDTVPAGGMLSVAMPAEELKAVLGEDLDLGAINAPSLSIATGPQAALDALQEKLGAMDVDCQRIPIDIAAHSRMLEPILQDFGDYLRSIKLSSPQIPFTSNLSGDYITEAEATDPEYWVAHLRNTVRFADCISALADTPDRVFIEVGPGKALASLTGQHDKVAVNQVISSLRHQDDSVADDAYFMAMLGRIWAVGGNFDWAQIWGDARRNRVPLPGYAFQRAPYFIEPATAKSETAVQWLMREDDPQSWGYRPAWRPRYADCEIDVRDDLGSAAKETWLIFTDDSGLGTGIVDRLRAAGQTVITVQPGDAFARSGEDSYVIAPERGRESYDALIRDLIARDQVPTRIVHGWLVTSGENFRPGSSFFHRNQEQGFYSLLFLAQAIGEENLSAPLHVTVLTTGALQVRDEKLPYPEKVTVLGPARVIPREFPGLTCAVLDVELPETIPRRRGGAALDHLAERVLEDLVAPPANATVALRGEKRFELSVSKFELPQPNVDSLLLRDQGVYLITGGFGGIGLTVAASLIKEKSAHIALLSRSPMPPRLQWDNILKRSAPQDPTARRIREVQKLEAAGGQVLCLAADVSNVEDMQAASAEATRVFGKVNGVIHAAGLIDDAPIMTKLMTGIEDVFTPKIHGTQVLETVFPDGELDFLALFSSTSTVTAPPGQVDYVAANEYLNAYAKSRRGGKTRTLAINWGIWSDVGMAAEAMQARTGNQEPAPIEPAGVPMLDDATFDAAGNRIFTASYTANSRWFLDEHRTLAGDALLPGTGYLELAAEALQAQDENGPFEIRDLYFLRPLGVDNTTPQQVQLRLPRSEAGYDFVVESGQGGDVETNAQGSLSLLPLETPASIDIDAVAARCGPPKSAGGQTGKTGQQPDFLTSSQEAHLSFGARWRVLRSAALGEGEGLARLSLDDRFVEDLNSGYLMHPGLLDLATGWAMELISGYQPTHLWVPVSYQSVKVYQPLPGAVFSWVRNAGDNRSDGQIATFDITLVNEAGEVCVEIHGFSIRRMETSTDFAQSGSSVVSAPADAASPPPLSHAEERLRHNLSQGIRPEEGADAFLSALETGLPQLIISSLDINGLTAQAAEVGADSSGSDQKFQRPELESDFVAPANDIESRLAGFWQELLGVEQVGVEDSFFDLGGHSLIAVRLFAQVRKAWQVDLPISVLFEAPTIRKCAEMIIASGVSANAGDTDDASGDPEAAPAPAAAATERRFTHLVPMHSGEGGSQTPFFLVAGMFGNVLNLRHLAHLLGADRPFYGLQARGLYGDEEPHLTLVDAARDYIAEMRKVQPHGPYMVGGFSGGGITAYEIARQLKASGEEIAALVMLDTPLPVARPLSRRDRVLIQLQELKKQGISYPYKWLKKRIAWEFSRRRGQDEAQDDTGTQFHDAAIEAAFLESVKTYHVEPWDGPLTLFRPPLSGRWQVGADRLVNSDRDYVLPDNGWTPWAPQIEIQEVPGDHDSMVLEPNVRVLAARMKRVIEAAGRNTSRPYSRVDQEAAE